MIPAQKSCQRKSLGDHGESGNVGLLRRSEFPPISGFFRAFPEDWSSNGRQNVRQADSQPGHNELCLRDSGKKYKRCHGATTGREELSRRKRPHPELPGGKKSRAAWQPGCVAPRSERLSFVQLFQLASSSDQCGCSPSANGRAFTTSTSLQTRRI